MPARRELAEGVSGTRGAFSFHSTAYSAPKASTSAWSPPIHGGPGVGPGESLSLMPNSSRFSGCVPGAVSGTERFLPSPLILVLRLDVQGGGSWSYSERSSETGFGSRGDVEPRVRPERL